MLVEYQLIVKVELECIGESSLLFTAGRRKSQLIVATTAFLYPRWRFVERLVSLTTKRRVTTPSATKAAPVAYILVTRGTS